MELDGANDYSSECHRWSLGRAKISLSNLAFEEEGGPGRRRLDRKNVERLVEVFDKEGCLRRDPRHFISAVIDDGILETAVRESGLLKGALFAAGDPPQLFLANHKVLCLHGKHRAAAAREHFFTASEWWIVDLYSTALGDDARAGIREEFSYASEFSHGDIYRNWCYYDKKGLEAEAERWMLRLSPGLQTDLRRLGNRSHRAFRSALEALHPFNGIWPAWRFGVIRRILKMRCPRECASYLKTVKRTLQFILGYDESLYQLTDYETIVQIQTRNPARNEADRILIDEGMERGVLFPRIRDPLARQQIRLRLQRIDKHIPSLHTFLEDTKWLEAAMEGMRSLFNPMSQPSIQAAMAAKFRPTSRLTVSNSAGAPVSYQGSRKALFSLAYIDLFAFAWRNFPHLSSQKPRVAKAAKAGRQSISAFSYNHVVVSQFQERARKLGFCIDADPVQSADERMINNFLNEVRPGAFFSVDNARRSAIKRGIARLIEAYEPKSASVAPIGFRPESSFSKRCGRPIDEHFEAVRHLFWPENLLTDDCGPENALLQIHRDTFQAFFGDEISACQDSYAVQSNLGDSPQSDQAAPFTNESRASTWSFHDFVSSPADVSRSPHSCSIYDTPPEMNSPCSPVDFELGR